MRDHFGRSLLERIKERATEEKSFLIDGRAQTFEDYRARVSKLRTLREVEEIMNEIDKEMHG